MSRRPTSDWARAPSNRPLRVAEAIRRELALPLQRLAAEAGLGLLTVTAVEVSGDLRSAKVFVSQMGEEVAPRQVMACLEQAGGRLRKGLGRALRLRFVPQLRFCFDESLERGVRLAALIDTLQATGGPAAGTEGDHEEKGT